MSVNFISKDELRKMEGSEGLIIQGCRGNLDEWVDGINEMLERDGIFTGEGRFHNCLAFKNEDLVCILFPFRKDVGIDFSKLAMWRLTTHQYFSGTWLSDYVPNRLGGFIKDTPVPGMTMI